MAIPGLHRTFDAASDIAPYRICTPGEAEHSVKQATAATDALIGTADELGKQANSRVDVCMGGLPAVEAGAAFAAGDPLTTDDQGRAVKAAEGGNRIIGIALEAATAAGDIVDYLFAPGYVGEKAQASEAA